MDLENDSIGAQGGTGQWHFTNIWSETYIRCP